MYKKEILKSKIIRISIKRKFCNRRRNWRKFIKFFNRFNKSWI